MTKSQNKKKIIYHCMRLAHIWGMYTLLILTDWYVEDKVGADRYAQ